MKGFCSMGKAKLSIRFLPHYFDFLKICYIKGENEKFKYNSLHQR